jgi:hypothetical protein
VRRNFGARVVTNNGHSLGCTLCELAQMEEQPRSLDGGIMVVYCDNELIALLKPGRPGVLLAPRQHVATISTLPGNSASFLAALRRTVTEVQRTYGASGAMIEPVTDLGGNTGHICFYVVPTLRDESEARQIDTVAQARGVAEVLRNRFSPPGLQPALRSAR